MDLEFLNISHNRLRQLLIDGHLSYEKLETLDVRESQPTFRYWSVAYP